VSRLAPANIAKSSPVGVYELSFVILALGIRADVDVRNVFRVGEPRSAAETEFRLDAVGLFSAVCTSFHNVLLFIFYIVTHFIGFVNTYSEITRKQ